MTRRLLTILCPGLLLVCCDKPGTSHTGAGANVPAPRVAGNGHAAGGNESGVDEVPAMTLQEAEAIQVPAAREKALAEVAWNAIDIDPELAREAFMQLPTASVEKIRLIRHYAMRLAEQDQAEAIAWAATLDSESEIAAANSQIALVIAETDPYRAANLLSESGIAGREFDVAVVEVLQRWAASSPADAAAWTITFQPGEAREAGIKFIVAKWARTDAQSTISWMTSLQDTAIRSEAALALEEALIQQPPAIREAWLQHADASTRSELEQQHAQAMKDVGDNVQPPAS